MSLENQPEEPHQQSELSVLSPASPKPIHFPAPSNIPVLNNMMDVSFNQTELHMQDPSMRNTEVREGAWKEIDEQENATESEKAQAETEVIQDGDDRVIIDPVPVAQESHDTDAQMTAQVEIIQRVEQVAAESDITALKPDDALLNDDSLLTPTALTLAEASPLPDTQEQLSSFSLPSNVDVQSLLASLQAAPLPNATNAAPQDAPAADPIGGTTIADTKPSMDEQATSVPATTAIAAQPGDDLVSALTRGFTPATGTSVAFNHVGSPATPSTQAANGIAQPRAPSSQRELKLAAGEPVTQEDVPWTADIQQKYDDFIQEERRYVNDGKWDQFPMGSRLFVGNLSSESVTKRDIFHVFHTYGPLAQISIKQAYGFVQFLHADDCDRALSTEQGTMIKDKRIHLEISKPQKSRNQNKNRSRSPANRGAGRSGHDRSQGSRSERDIYRGLRSPSPRGAYRDRYDDRQRNRQRSPEYGRSRYTRSPSPRRYDAGDDLPLPRRAPQDVPEIQIIVKDQNIDRRLIEMVENSIGAARFRVAVLLLKPNLNEDAAIQRQLVEGVLAIVRLDRRSMETGRVLLRIFDRSLGADRVQFSDYDYIDVATCVGLLDRARGASRQAPTQAQYGMPMQQQPLPSYAQSVPTQYGYGAPSAPPQPYGLPPGYPPQFLTQPSALQQPQQQMDPASLQNLLSAARNGQPPQQARLPMANAPYGYPAPQTNYNQQPPPQQAYASANSWMQQQQSAARPAPPPSAPPAGQVNMQDILARLGTYK